jgi:hypothetical protein
MAKKELTEKSETVGKVKLFNSSTNESLMVTEDELRSSTLARDKLVNYDVLHWSVM